MLRPEYKSSSTSGCVTVRVTEDAETGLDKEIK